jgi:hypothetical protein
VQRVTLSSLCGVSEDAILRPAHVIRFIYKRPRALIMIERFWCGDGYGAIHRRFLLECLFPQIPAITPRIGRFYTLILEATRGKKQSGTEEEGQTDTSYRSRLEATE